MLSRILIRYGAMTPRQRIAIVAVVALPALMLVTLLAGAAAEAVSVGATVALSLLAVWIVGGIAYVLTTEGSWGAP
ncbi:hypothetical protein [Microcella sp.]|uniref:hypothetical protein n=1 Tax=Microcella sp. TaxID=1913979 RepID=UPI003F722C5B